MPIVDTVETDLYTITDLVDQSSRYDELRSRLDAVTRSVRAAYLAPTPSIARCHIADALGTLTTLPAITKGDPQ